MVTEKLKSQEMFNIMATHLLKQGKRASIKVKGGEICCYRTDNGLKCSIGILIPDSLYTTEMEGNNVTSLLRNLPELRKFIPDENLAVQLQDLHDHVDPKNWKKTLQTIAEVHKLEFNLN